MAVNNQVTIVLTLKDRTPFTYRWLRYMNDIHCPYKIIIADGGEDKDIERHLYDHTNYPYLDYEYLRYPFDGTIDDFYIKFVDAISRVESEYLLLADNDDFYYLDRIPDILGFLDSHRDYVGARGHLVDLTLFDKSGLSNGLTSGVRYEAMENNVPSIENPSLFDRVEALCRDMKKNDYYANWYCIFRSAIFKEVANSFFTLPAREMIVAEVLSHVLIMLKGKIKIMPFPFYIRQRNTSMFGDTLVVDNDFLERCLIKNALSEFGIAVDQFVEVKTKDERDRILRAIAAWLEEFVSHIYWGRIQAKANRVFNLKEKIKHVPLLDTWVMRLVRKCLKLPLRERKKIRLKPIEPYILEMQDS